ncbi:hypothetical protein M7I_7537 [Glarea lozoyensis 74030]|uniref:Uncharacterized protein n=1 Tax=Glarea lozoyensis (strain ATCC 74030 / MF5533) TaxID=1104152 RepID=H0EXK1_GLAL7|nr:hypothetical protein M7I_7537 [Glarea lozoyensis 74030]
MRLLLLCGDDGLMVFDHGVYERGAAIAVLLIQVGILLDENFEDEIVACASGDVYGA